MTGLRLIESNAETFLLDYDAGFRNVGINSLGVTIRADNFLLKIYFLLN